MSLPGVGSRTCHKTMGALPAADTAPERALSSPPIYGQAGGPSDGGTATRARRCEGQGLARSSPLLGPKLTVLPYSWGGGGGAPRGREHPRSLRWSRTTHGPALLRARGSPAFSPTGPTPCPRLGRHRPLGAPGEPGPRLRRLAGKIQRVNGSRTAGPRVGTASKFVLSISQKLSFAVTGRFPEEKDASEKQQNPVNVSALRKIRKKSGATSPSVKTPAGPDLISAAVDDGAGNSHGRTFEGGGAKYITSKINTVFQSRHQFKTRFNNLLLPKSIGEHSIINTDEIPPHLPDK